MQYATKHQASRFKVYIRNEYGKPCTCDQNVFVVLTNTVNKSETAVHINRILDTAGDYEALYTPSWHGTHELCIKINGDHINGSPFKVLVDNPPDPQHCTVSGPGVRPVVARDKCNLVSFEVHLADSDNEPCITEHSVTATLRMVRSGSAVETEMNMLPQFVHQFSYIPLEAGTMEVEVNVNGISIGKCPLEVHVDNLPDPAHCKIITPHIELQTVKKDKTKHFSFDIQLADSYNEPCVFEQDVAIDMVMRQARSLSHTIPFSVICKSPSLYQVSFIPDKAGEMEVSIMVNKTTIKHSPYHIHVHNPPDPQHCRVLCSELLFIAKNKTKSVSGEIHLVDSYNEPCAFEQNVTVTMVRSKPGVDGIQTKHLNIICKSPSLYQVSFITDIAGEWVVDVKINGVPLSEHPIKLVIDNPPCIEHCELLDLQEQLKKGTHYTFRIRLADSENKMCEIPQHVTATLTMTKSQSPVPVTVTCVTPSQYAVSFTPHRAGWMSGCVEINDTDMPPIRVLVTNPPDPEHCSALGPGLEPVKKHKSNPVSFQVRLADSDNEPCVSQQDVTVTLKMKSSGLQIPVEQIVIDDPPVYNISYTPAVAGEMEVSILVNGAHIKHSPWTVHVHNPPDPQHCRLSCSKLLHKKGKQPASAQIHLMDSYNELCVFEEDTSIAIEIIILGPHVRESMPVENVDFICKSPSLCQVSFIPDVAGEWIVDVKINGVPLSEHPIKLVIDNPPCIEHCELLDLQEQLKKGTHYTFRIRLADSENKMCEIPQHVTATLTMTKSQSPVPVTVTCVTPSQYAVSFTPHRAGWMSGCVEINDTDMPPIRVLVTNPPDPEHCSALGPGLESVKKHKSNPVFFQVRLADSDNEPCVSQQDVTVTLKMKSSGLQIPVEQIVIDDPPVYNISYTPAVAGEMEVSILVNGAHIKHSPWTVHVHNPPDPQHCRLSCSKLLHKKGKQPASAQIHLMDSYNELCVFEEDTSIAIEIIILGPHVRESMPVENVDFICKSPSLCQVSFIPDVAGEWIVDVKLNDVPISKSPFKLVIDNPPYIENCEILGLQKKLQKGTRYTFRIGLADSENKMCEIPQHVTATLTMTKSQSPVPVTVTCETPSQYAVSFTPHRAGWMTGCVEINDTDMPPIRVLVTNPPDPEHCSALGPGLESVKKHKSNPVSFQVRLADSDNEPCVSQQDVTVTLKMKSSGLQIPVQQIVIDDPPVYNISYTPAVAGEMEVSILVNGAHIKHSPWTVHVHNPPDPRHCRLSLSDHLVKDKSSPVSGKLHIMDSYNEPCASKQNFKVTMVKKGVLTMHPHIICKSLSLYQISFVPYIAGEWRVDVKINDVPVLESPFKLVIDNPPFIRHCESLDLEHQLQKGTQYTSRITLVDSYNELCEIPQHVTATLTMIKSQSPVPVTVTCETPSQYAVSFTPHRAGWMSGCVEINDTDMPPIRVLVTNTPDPGHCSALGPGLESVKKHKSNPVFFQVRLADSDNEPCVSQQDVTVTLKMKSSGLQIPVEQIVIDDPPVYNISYTPAVAGEMEVSILVNGAHIKHSPWTVHVHNPPDPQHCRLSCSKLLHKKGKQPASAQIHLMDSYNELCVFEEDTSIAIEIIILGPHVRESMPVENVDFICKSPSLCQVSFIPDVAGEWIVDVKINGVPLSEHPIKLVIDNPPCIEHCELLDLQEQLKKGTHYTFRIRLADSENKMCEIPQHVTATLTMTKSQSPVPVTVTCVTPSQYAVSFTPHRAGWMSGCVEINDTDMPPIRVLVTNPPDPEHCSALGPGLESVKKHKSNPVFFQVRLADSDNEPCVSQQDVTVTLKMKSSGLQIPVEQIVIDDPPVYNISYTPAVAGEMEVSILVNGAHIKHSPWTVHVHNPPDPQHCRLSCSKLLHKKGKQPASAQIHLMDSYNELCVFEEDTSIAIEIIILGPHVRESMPVENVDFICKSPSLCQVSFIPDVAGEWIVDVKLNDVPISKSPFKLVIDNPPYIENCEILGLQKKLQKGTRYTFRIGLADSENKMCEIPQHVTATLTMTKSQSPVPVTVTCETPSQYAVSFTPHRAGWMTGCVEINDTDMPPIRVLVTNPPDPEHCSALGPGLESVKKHKSNPVSFQVRLADSDNEPCVSQQDVTVTLKMKSSGLQIPVQQIVIDDPPVYNISYTPAVAGEMEVSILVNGAHIKHSPWTVHVHNPPDPRHCRLSLSDHLVKDKSSPVSGKLHIMDSYNEPCASKQNFKVTMVKKGVLTMHPHIICKSLSLYQISFVPYIAGEWRVDVKINDVPVLESPFKLVIDNPPFIRHCESLDLEHQLQKGTQYTSRITLVDSYNELCEIPQHVTATLTMIKSQSPVPVTVTCETPSQYAVSFTPHRAGWMSGCVEINDTDMPPIRVLVTNPPDPEHCSALGPGLESVKKHKSNPVFFQVRLADSDNEPCVSQQDVTVTLKMKSSGLQIPVEQIVIDDPPVYNISYTPAVAGEMEVSILVNGAHIKHSPRSIHVYPWYALTRLQK